MNWALNTGLIQSVPPAYSTVNLCILLPSHVPNASYRSDQHPASCLCPVPEWSVATERKGARSVAGRDEPFSRSLYLRQTIRRSQMCWNGNRCFI